MVLMLAPGRIDFCHPNLVFYLIVCFVCRRASSLKASTYPDFFCLPFLRG